jgi:hypothetical protein
MDKGPFRAQRPESKKSAEQTPSQWSETSIMPEAPRASYSPRYQSQQLESKSAKRFVVPVAIAVLVLVLAVIGWFVLSRQSSLATTIDSDKYQAVFFSNGQVYFGKLKAYNSDYLQLTDIFYLQSQNQQDVDQDSKDDLQASSSQDGELKLIKLGNEVHGPEDEMMISKEQILFFENLKSDSKVASSIGDYKQSN